MGPDRTPQRLLGIALGWIQFRAQNSGYPAAMQIKTGLTTLYLVGQRRTNGKILLVWGVTISSIMSAQTCIITVRSAI